MPQTMEQPPGEWVDLGYAEERLGFKAVVLLRLIRDGVMPAMQLAGATRKAHRIPRSLVDEAYATVMSGGQVEIREFCRQWKARNAVPEAVA